MYGMLSMVALNVEVVLCSIFICEFSLLIIHGYSCCFSGILWDDVSR